MKREKILQDPGSFTKKIIKAFIENSAENTLQNKTQEKAFGNPLIGFSRGDDPLYESYKEFVGPYHWTPQEIFTQTFGDRSAKPEELTVISWILPQTEATKADNREEVIYPSERWARARIYGEEVNAKLRKRIVAAFDEAGLKAVAPMLSPLWERKKSEQFTIASTWSERHAAYASGLGTFGLCDGLITPLGKAMRTGSVVACVQIPHAPRPYDDHHAYCTFFTEGACGECIPRCPVGAITEKGHDKMKCLQHIRQTAADYVKTNYGFKGYGCGLCQTGVPCESKIPNQ